MTLMLSSMWLNVRPFPSVWLNFTSHKPLQCRHQSHTVKSAKTFLTRSCKSFQFNISIAYRTLTLSVACWSLLLISLLPCCCFFFSTWSTSSRTSTRLFAFRRSSTSYSNSDLQYIIDHLILGQCRKRFLICQRRGRKMFPNYTVY